MNEVLRNRLLEPRARIQFVSGPRQVGKTTSVRIVLESLGLPWHYASADGPEMQTREWVDAQWSVARRRAETDGVCVLALDEVQKVPGWSDVVKRHWDEDTAADRDVRAVLLGSSPWLMDRGVGESLTGRFETIRATHWSFAECRDAFGWDVDQFVFFGGYPGAADLVGDEQRWRAFVRDSIIETSLSRDVLHVSRIEKPALLRRLFYLACEYSGRELSLRKMMGELEDAGNATTLAHYLDLLQGAGLARGLQKFAGEAVRRRASSPKLQVDNTALMSAFSGRSFGDARGDAEYWGRLVESAVGSYLVSQALIRGAGLHYWRDGTREVDFVLADGSRVAAIEVKTSARGAGFAGFAAFEEAFGLRAEKFLVGPGGIPLEDFLGGEGGV